ncbi:MAG: hypothetical protein PF638_08055 [Candidatus Delongbacteria bacterium]|jgi:hypothetical protein|nr:hypothetical protein [Candidatus Delongbacteria bacterium]
MYIVYSGCSAKYEHFNRNTNWHDVKYGNDELKGAADEKDQVG